MPIVSACGSTVPKRPSVLVVAGKKRRSIESGATLKKKCSTSFVLWRCVVVTGQRRMNYGRDTLQRESADRDAK